MCCSGKETTFFFNKIASNKQVDFAAEQVKINEEASLHCDLVKKKPHRLS